MKGKLPKTNNVRTMSRISHTSRNSSLIRLIIVAKLGRESDSIHTLWPWVRYHPKLTTHANTGKNRKSTRILMPRIFGILCLKKRPHVLTELANALARANLREIDGLGPSTYLAASEDSEICKIPTQSGSANILIQPSAFQTASGTGAAEYDLDPASINGPFLLVKVPSPDRQSLTIDRFAQQRLTFAKSRHGELIFASGIDLLACHPDIELVLHNQAIYNYLFFHEVPSPGSVYRDIHKLPPAHRLEFDGTNFHFERYWRPHFSDTLTDSLSTKRDAVYPAIIDAVRRCGMTPNTGAFLSGGLDSSSVCGALQSLTSEPVKAFSVGFRAEGYDEIQFAESAARHFRLDHRVHYITPQEVSDAVPRIAQNYDEPFGNSSAVPTLVCAEFARSCGVSRLLAGDGGDEIFSGNTRYRKQKIFESYFAIPNLLRSGLIQPLFATRSGSSILGKGPLRKITRYVDQALIPLPDRLETHNILQMVALAEVLEPDFIASIDVRAPFELMRREWDSLGEAHYQDKMLYVDWKLTLADNDLRKVTEMANLAGIEVCYPLLDNAIVDLATSIPARYRIPGLRLRHFYREALREFLPKETLTKSKHGFGLPFGEWARTDPGLRDITIGALTKLRKRRIIKEGFLASVQRQHMEEHAGFYGNMVWVLMMLELWLETHDVVV
jgi:asparagine synthase (glutamine-hydrolysing)